MSKPIWVIHKNGDPYFHSSVGIGPWIGDRSLGQNCSMLAAYRLKGSAEKALKGLQNNRDIWEIEPCHLTSAVIPIGGFDDAVWSVRTANCLHNIGITSFEQLTDWTEAELLKVRNLGRKSLREIQKMLALKGLKLKNS